MDIELFDKLSQMQRKTLQVAKGDCLFWQDDSTFAMFMVQKGQVQLLRHNENGDTIILHHAFATDTFAEAALFSNHYHCDAIAVENTQLSVFDRAKILTEIHQNPKFAILLTAHFARHIQTLRRRLEIQSIRKAETRIFTALSEGLLIGDIKSFAAKIGLTHEATYRGLADLVKNKRLEKVARGQYQLPKAI